MFGRSGYYRYVTKNSYRAKSPRQIQPETDEEIWSELFTLLRLSGVILVATTVIALILTGLH